MVKDLQENLMATGHFQNPEANPLAIKEKVSEKRMTGFPKISQDSAEKAENPMVSAPADLKNRMENSP